MRSPGSGCQPPDRHAQIADGTHGRPSTGIFMMPSADTAGALETLLVEAILQKRGNLGDCLRQLDGVPRDELR